MEVIDRKNVTEKREVREKAQQDELGSVGAPMAGDIVEVSVTPGARVKAGEQLVVMSAMKMETAVCAPCDGLIQHVAIDKGDVLDAGDLLVMISTGVEMVGAAASSGNGSSASASN